MHSPSKNDKLIQEDQLETGSDGIPQEIWDDIKKNENFIYYGLMFLNGSVLWAYYSCLTAQNFYATKFADTKYNFSFLTTLCTAWPMVGGHFIQIVTGFDKKVGQKPRVYAGYAIFIVCSILIMVFSAIKFTNPDTGALLVLIMFGCIGFGNSLSEATYYLLAALFPVEKFTNAVQIGNVCAGVLNVTIATLLRLIVGGPKATKSSDELAFYLFFGLLIVVLIAAVFLYKKLTSLPCIVFLLERNEASTREHNLALNPVENVRNLMRVFTIIWVPAVTQWLIFFVSLSVFPGFGCAAGRNLTPKYTSTVYGPVTGLWYCSPGIIGSYNYGDFIGRIICTAAVYKLFSMKLAFGLAILRIAYIPIMLMGVAGTSVYIFGAHVEAALVWNILFNLTIGITTGLLSTITMGVAPRLCKPEDRETAGAVMVFFLFLGIASGAHFGSDVSTHGWLGL
jgi:solute carrier family 29 (equilibrative nucleoside transporter), member 1/2/3